MSESVAGLLRLLLKLLEKHPEAGSELLEALGPAQPLISAIEKHREVIAEFYLENEAEIKVVFGF